MFVGATLSIFHTVTVYQEWAEKQGASRESQNSGKCCVDARGQRRTTSLFGADRKVTLDRTSLLSANNRTLRLTLTKAGQQKIKQRFPGLSLCFGIKVAASEFGLSSMKGSCFGCGVTVTAILFDTYQKALKTTAYPKTAADRPFVTTV